MLDLIFEPIERPILEQFNAGVSELILARRELEAFRQRQSKMAQALEERATAAQALVDRLAEKDERLKQFLHDADLRAPLAHVSI